MHIGSAMFKEDYCLITANGKTGIKHITLVISCKPLLDWLEDHPKKGENSTHPYGVPWIKIL